MFMHFSIASAVPVLLREIAYSPKSYVQWYDFAKHAKLIKVTKIKLNNIIMQIIVVKVSYTVAI